MSGQLFTDQLVKIESKSAKGFLYHRLRISAVSVVDALAAVRISDDLEALRVTVSSESLVKLEEWPECSGFHVKMEPEQAGSPHSDMHLYLQLSDARYRDVFHALCNDICSVLANLTEKENAAKEIHTRLVKWISFLRQHREGGLSPESQVGLFGELLILRDLFLPELSPLVAVSAWRGCKKAQQDFQFPDRAMEVKTSRATTPEKVSISSIQQLDEKDLDPLVLSLVHVHAGESSGESLPDLIAGLRSVMGVAEVDLLNEGLQEVGYLDSHEKKYERQRYQLNGIRHFLVGEGFPRILRENLPDGIKNVTYQISLDAIGDFLLEDAEVKKFVEGVKSGNDD